MKYTIDEKSLSSNRSLVTISGRITAANAGEIKTTIQDIIKEGKTELVFDLSGVSFLDSSGLSVFVSILRLTREGGGWIKLAALSEVPGNIFRITMLDRVMDMYPDVETALKSAEL